MNTNRYSTADLEKLAAAVRQDGHCILKNHFPLHLIEKWNESFQPLLQDHIEREGHLKNRGANRYYVTLPFEKIWAEPQIYEDPDILAICEDLVGADMVMCQLATDTPLKGSEYQAVHRDAPPLFPEIKQETPAFQLAVNFPLIDVTSENGPFEVVRGTHLMTKEEGLEKLERGELNLEPIFLNAGDVMIRDVRALHRGTPNHTLTPRPMAVIGYSRRWLFRPEVSIPIPKSEYQKLSHTGRMLLRFNPIVDSLENLPKTEVYQTFSY
jgi:ectoine hydroxylase-related dioxygenase (phytanoyl-CoA dioxygenase family)